MKNRGLLLASIIAVIGLIHGCTLKATCELDEYEENGECLKMDAHHCGYTEPDCATRMQNDSVTAWECYVAQCEDEDPDCEKYQCWAAECDSTKHFQIGYDNYKPTCVCETHYHLSKTDNACEDDNLNACGSLRQDCKPDKSIKDAACRSGYCVIKECEIGYYLKDDSCVAYNQCEPMYFFGKAVHNPKQEIEEKTVSETDYISKSDCETKEKCFINIKTDNYRFLQDNAIDLIDIFHGFTDPGCPSPFTCKSIEDANGYYTSWCQIPSCASNNECQHNQLCTWNNTCVDKCDDNNIENYTSMEYGIDAKTFKYCTKDTRPLICSTQHGQSILNPAGPNYKKGEKLSNEQETALNSLKTHLTNALSDEVYYSDPQNCQRYLRLNSYFKRQANALLTKENYPDEQYRNFLRLASNNLGICRSDISKFIKDFLATSEATRYNQILIENKPVWQYIDAPGLCEAQYCDDDILCKDDETCVDHVCRQKCDKQGELSNGLYCFDESKDNDGSLLFAGKEPSYCTIDLVMEVLRSDSMLKKMAKVFNESSSHDFCTQYNAMKNAMQPITYLVVTDGTPGNSDSGFDQMSGTIEITPSDSGVINVGDLAWVDTIDYDANRFPRTVDYLKCQDSIIKILNAIINNGYIADPTTDKSMNKTVRSNYTKFFKDFINGKEKECKN